MKALVTGASGFIGSTLIEELDRLGFEARALMRRTSSAANLEGVKFERVEGDLSDAESLRRAVKDVDYVFHLAGVVAAKDRDAYFENNCAGTLRLAEAVAEARPGLSRFVFVSSMAAGGPASSSRSPRDESHADAPVSAYGESKLQAERELLRFKDAYPISIVRPPMVYGPKDKATFVFIQTVSRNLMPIFRASNGDGQKYYSSIHVKDLVRGIVQAAVAPKDKVPSGEIFYLASDEAVSYEQLMSTIAEHLNRDPLRFRVPIFALKAAALGLTAVGRVTNRTFPLNLDKLNEILPDYWVCSNRKARDRLGFVPEFEVQAGMANAIDWYKRQHWI
jgi:nucleoside-diphosphate-sugar epimerase